MGTRELDSDDLAPDDPARQLADRLRLLASVDPELARVLVAELVAALDRATAGAFGAHLSPASRSALGLIEPSAAWSGGNAGPAAGPAPLAGGVAALRDDHDHLTGG